MSDAAEDSSNLMSTPPRSLEPVSYPTRFRWRVDGTGLHVGAAPFCRISGAGGGDPTALHEIVVAFSERAASGDLVSVDWLDVVRLRILMEAACVRALLRHSVVGIGGSGALDITTPLREFLKVENHRTSAVARTLVDALSEFDRTAVSRGRLRPIDRTEELRPFVDRLRTTGVSAHAAGVALALWIHLSWAISDKSARLGWLENPLLSIVSRLDGQPLSRSGHTELLRCADAIDHICYALLKRAAVPRRRLRHLLYHGANASSVEWYSHFGLDAGTFPYDTALVEWCRAVARSGGRSPATLFRDSGSTPGFFWTHLPTEAMGYGRRAPEWLEQVADVVERAQFGGQMAVYSTQAAELVRARRNEGEYALVQVVDGGVGRPSDFNAALLEPCPPLRRLLKDTDAVFGTRSGKMTTAESFFWPSQYPQHEDEFMPAKACYALSATAFRLPNDMVPDQLTFAGFYAEDAGHVDDAIRS